MCVYARVFSLVSMIPIRLNLTFRTRKRRFVRLSEVVVLNFCFPSNGKGDLHGANEFFTRHKQ